MNESSTATVAVSGQREEVIGLKGSFRGSGCFDFGLLVDDRLSQFAKRGICVFLLFQDLIHLKTKKRKGSFMSLYLRKGFIHSARN
jgi:hypothetical protein